MSITELEQQIEAVRQEAYADGYAAAMKEMKELTARPAPDGNNVRELSRNRGGSRGTQEAAPKSRLAHRRRNTRTVSRTAGATSRTDRSAMRRSRRGTNAVLIAEVLKSAAPRALRQAEIRRALQDKGKTMSFPSIGYSLRQLAARNAARQVGNSKTWRYQEA